MISSGWDGPSICGNGIDRLRCVPQRKRGLEKPAERVLSAGFLSGGSQIDFSVLSGYNKQVEKTAAGRAGKESKPEKKAAGTDTGDAGTERCSDER